MSNESFPKIEVEHCGGDTFDEAEFFRIWLNDVEASVETAMIQGAATMKRTWDQDLVNKEFAASTKSAVGLLAVAVAKCDTCPVKKSKVCTGIKAVDLMKQADLHKALLQANGVKSHNNETVEDQINGNLCGITASSLNSIHPVKMTKW